MNFNKEKIKLNSELHSPLIRVVFGIALTHIRIALTEFGIALTEKWFKPLKQVDSVLY